MSEIEKAQKYIREHYPKEMHERLFTALEVVITEGEEKMNIGITNDKSQTRNVDQGLS